MLWLFWIFCGSTLISRLCILFCEKYHWDLMRTEFNWIWSTDCFWWWGLFNNINYCNPWMWSVFPFVYVCWRTDSGVPRVKPEMGPHIKTPVFLGFPTGLNGKESAWNAEDLGLNPGLGGSPGGGRGNPLQYSCLEDPHGGELGGLQSMGLQRVGYDWETRHNT